MQILKFATYYKLEIEYFLQMDFKKVKFRNGELENQVKSSKTAGAEKIYERKEYIILRVKRGYIVYNTRKNFENGHTHLQSFEMSKTIIDNSISHT